jgi:tetratricopeptide (TPR) repeat protein
MNRYILYFALSLSLLSSCVFGQATSIGGNAQSPAIDRTEILGRLSLGYSPSYVGYLVETRGVSFTPSADFISLVKLAGGDGILVERLTSVDTSSSANSSGEQDKPIDHLARCAELLHTGAQESAEAECRAGIQESPRSPWPLLIVAKFLPSEPLPPNSSETDKAKTAEHDALVARAAALAPDLPAVHFCQPLNSVQLSNGSADWQRAYVLDSEQFSIAESRDVNYLLPDFSQADEGSSRPSPESLAPAAINSELLREIELEPEIASKHMTLARLYEQTRDLERAQSEFLEAIRLEPDNPALHMELARIFFVAQDLDSCVAELREAARSVPFGVNEHIALSAALESTGHTTEAVSELKMLVDVHPADARASDTLVGLYLQHKNRKPAIEELQRSLKVASLTYTDEAELVDARYGDEQQLAQLLREDRQFEAGSEQFRFLLRMRPDDAGLHNDYGNVFLDQHDDAAAVDEYYAALRLDPQMSAAHNNIGICLARKKDLDGAIVEFRKALDINPNEPHTRIYLGTALGQKGDLKAAKDQFEDTIQRNPKDAETQGGVAFALIQLKDEASAITHLRTALELQPDSPADENNLAWLYATAEDPKLRKPAEALVLARRAVEASPSPNPAFLDTLAEAQLLNGKRTEALATETRAAALDPDNSELQSRLAHFRQAVSAPASSNPELRR